MKKIYILSLAVLSFTMACTSVENKYEKAIADYVQTDRSGTWTDLQFKVVSLETSDVTVADSIKIVRAEFETARTAAIESEKKSIRYWMEVISDNPRSREVNRYNENIAGINRRIDSLQSISSSDAARYNGLAPERVLAIKAKCWYSYVMPGGDTRQERTDTFVLSPDGKQVIGKENKAE